MVRLIPGLLLALMLVLSCSKPPDYDDTPRITYAGVSRTTILQGADNSDTLRIFFDFEDGDGDIGSNNTNNVFVIDKRTGNITDRFTIPEIPPDGAGNGVSGTISILKFNECCIFPDGVPPCIVYTPQPTDTVVFEIYMQDLAGNESNRIETEPIVLLCQ